ncbi:MAG: efflux RND transporter periplasmic adaptor subunit [Megasphaera sp.]|uniref:HlyD family secretion protein n=1 Tax=Megasphaera sueciensis TaxID=349094 RepID=UPI003CFEC745|nr:efflux RND transporter periplasmic adaptor subunit [Megasphaera sp.]MCI1822842.1 efflux RND transporter periplasmic adaptor subunit [Megasphaera sp.]
MKKNIPKKIVIGIFLVLVLIGTAMYKLYNPSRQEITATGTIEVTKADIMPKVSGYISGISFDVGSSLKQGQVVVQIDRPDIKAQLLRDEAAWDKAKAQLQDLENGPRPQELADASANVQSAQAVYEKTQNDYQRYMVLYQQEAISVQQLDASKSAADVAYRTLQSAQAKLSLLQEGNRTEVIAAQRREVERTGAILEATRTQEADTTIYCPADGLVLTKNFENGEYVGVGSPIATIGEMGDCWVKIYVASEQLGRIKTGQVVAVRVDSFPNRVFQGKIKEISQNAEYTPRQSITQRERANMVFAVKVKLDNSENIFKPGMPADVVIG